VPRRSQQTASDYFVCRNTGEKLERENVRRLAEGLSPQDGVLLYPEGTRFTTERRERAIKQIAERDPRRARRVERIEHLLPPKVGGFLSALDGAPGVDVVVMAHAGFDGLRLISDMWRGALVGRTIRVRFDRTARASDPEGHAWSRGVAQRRLGRRDEWVDAQVALPRTDRARHHAGSDVVPSVPG